MLDIMIDLETLSTRADAVITQIGVAAFDREGTGLLDDGLQLHLDVNSSLERGLIMDWGTISWWMEQEDAARKALTKPQYSHDLGSALDLVDMYFLEVQRRTQAETFVWANPSAFDHAILTHSYRVLGRREPWSHRRVMCCRTLKALAPDAQRPEPDLPHHALSDSKSQALWVQNMWRSIQTGVSP